MIDKRKHDRMDIGYDVFMTHRGRTSAARTRDISPRGIAIYTDQALAPDDPLDLTITFSERMLNLGVKGAVRYCITNPDPARQPQSYLAGIEFDE